MFLYRNKLLMKQLNIQKDNFSKEDIDHSEDALVE